MKKFIVLACAAMLVFGVAGMASALNLLQNGDFETGDFSGWTTNNDVQIGDTADPFGFFASAQGMVGNYALLGLNITDGQSTLRQDFEVSGFTELTISFDWAFDYWDNSASADDAFLSFVRQDGQPAKKITLLDLQTHGTGFFGPDAGMAYGHYTETIDISGYTTDDARMIFRLIEESDNRLLTGTASVAGIDNVMITGTAPVPEPSTVLLLSVGVLSLVGFGRKKFKK